MNRVLRLLTSLLIAVPGSVWAEAPALVNFQGRLVDSSGVPVNTPQTVLVSIYSAPTGGAPLWSQTIPDVPVANGIFAVQFGDGGLLDATGFGSADRWLGVTVGAGPELAPREKLASVPTSIYAAKAGRLAATGGLVTIPDAVSIAGNVGIGTTAPYTTLDVKGGIRQFGLFDNAAVYLGARGGVEMPLLVDDRRGSGASLVVSNNGALSGGVFVVNADGSVGIGTTSPGSKLEVNGRITLPGDVPGGGEIVWRGTSMKIDRWGDGTVAFGDVMFFKDQANVGIGTTSPAARLDVAGNARVEGDLVLGNGALKGYSSTAVHSVYGRVGIGTDTVDTGVALHLKKTDAHLVLQGTGQTTQLSMFAPQNALLRLQATGAGGAAWDIRTDATASGMPAPGALRFLTSAGERMVLTSAGDLGVGTTSPAAKLDVGGAAQVAGFKMPTGAASGFVLTSDASGTGTWAAPAASVGGSGTAGYLSKFTGTSTLGNSVVYEASGNVGIGTTSPAYPLVVAPATGHAQVQVKAAAGSSGSATARLDGDTDTNTSQLLYNFRGTERAFATWQEANKRFLISTLGSPAPSDAGSIHINPGNVLGTGLSVLPNGNVGIGTTNPQYRLEAYATPNAYIAANNGAVRTVVESWGASGGWIGTLTNHKLYLGANDTTPQVVLDTTGNVGIGTSSPSYRLDVVGTLNAQQVLVNGVAVGTGGTQWVDGGSGAIYYSAGNVGIGTTAPGYKLDVLGTNIRFGDTTATLGRVGSYAAGTFLSSDSSGLPLMFWTNSPASGFAERMRVDPNGNVGIGTTSPQTRLDVVGDMTLSGKLFDTGTLGVVTSGPSTEFYYGNLSQKRLTAFYGNEKAGLWAHSSNQPGGSYGLHFVTPTTSSSYPDITRAVAVNNQGAIPTLFGYGGYLRVGNAATAALASSENDLLASGRFEVAGQSYFAGKVGIGTTAPFGSYPRAGVHLHSSDASGTHLRLTNAAGPLWTVMATGPGNGPGAGQFAIEQTGTDYRLVIDGATGKVGIGTTSPAAKLDVAGAARISGGIVADNAGAGFQSGKTTIDYAGLFVCHDDPLCATASAWPPTGVGVLIARAHPALLVKNAIGPAALFEQGNVGIGLTAPEYKLHVKGPGVGGMARLVNAGNSAAIELGSADPDTVYIAGGGWDALTFRTGTSASYERMRIGITGDVGIGTESPTQGLHVYRTAGDSVVMADVMTQPHNPRFALGYQGAIFGEFYRDSATGAVYLGTRDAGSPLVLKTGDQARLTVDGYAGNVKVSGGDAIDQIIRLENTSSSGLLALNAYGSTGAGTHGGGIDSANTNSVWSNKPLFLTVQGTNPLHLFTNDQPRLTVSGTGNVGIGTTNPEWKLEVIGAVQIDRGVGWGLRLKNEGTGVGDGLLGFGNNAGNNGMGFRQTVGGDLALDRYQFPGAGWLEALRVERNTGNVGIGTTAPTARLQVAGTVKADGLSVPLEAYDEAVANSFCAARYLTEYPNWTRAVHAGNYQTCDSTCGSGNCLGWFRLSSGGFMGTSGAGNSGDAGYFWACCRQ